MVAPLNPSELSAALAELPEWSGDSSGIRRTVQAENFLAGIDLVVEVARMAEDMNHHPDIDIRWRNVTFGLSTHDAGGVTSLDIDLAKRIDAAAG
jgi:4a-hydroxytetrahydrobiopterin dehydratase